ncbi:MAG TPA: DUF4389 domain-containing protein [Gaiella sp.]|nr:DUF4389 domain-containing protein [Gaiella sp.]
MSASHPVRVVVTDDLRRRRLTVLFRLLLALPHLVWATLYGAAAFTLAFVVWLAVLVERRAPGSLHRFLANYTRYTVHLTAYLCLAADPYPDFTGARPYPVDVEIDPPARQRRRTAAVRFLLAIPAFVLSSALAGSTALGAAYGAAVVAGIGGLGAVVATLGWFASVARGRMPRGMRDAAVYAIGYGAQTTAYTLLLTERYPDATPGRAEPAPELPPHPVGMRVVDDLRRPRLLVLFRVPLSIPHILLLTLWSAFALAAAVLAWLVALVAGRVPRFLHRFIAANIRAWTHLYAFLFVVGRPFPGFVGREGSYPIDLTIASPEKQRRLTVLFRPVLAIPALLLAAAYAGVAFVVAVLGWLTALLLGRMPGGLRDLGVAALRYQAQVGAYALLVTPRYPDSSPALVDRPAAEPEPLLAPDVVPVVP